jgi:hypothetical protein
MGWQGDELKRSLGSVVFATASFGSGVVALVWRETASATQWIAALAAVGLVLGGILLVGGSAVAFASQNGAAARLANLGAGILAGAYLLFVILTLPGIVAAPRVYSSWGNFFEQLSLLTGAGFALAVAGVGWPLEKVRRAGSILMGLCSASFAAQQAVLLAPTAGLVPKWMPLGQTFWAVATTTFFILAAVALIANVFALLASRALTAMVIGFGFVVWVPLIFLDSHSHGIWSETAETFAIGGAVWILAEVLGDSRATERPVG